MRLIGKGPWPANPRYCRGCFKTLYEKRAGAEIECTLLFIDIRGSTGLAESMPARDYRTLLDRFYASVSEVLIEHEAIVDKFGSDSGFGPGTRPLDLVFHGGSGSTAEEIAAAVDYGVVKMNVDTDTQYAFTRPVAAHMFSNYDGVLKVDGEVGNKKQYDPRAWGKAGEAGMAARVVEACENLRSTGHKL